MTTSHFWLEIRVLTGIQNADERFFGSRTDLLILKNLQSYD